MNIEGKGRVFAKEHDGWTSYTIGVSSKDKEGNWQNAYQPVRFKKGQGVPNGTDIEFKAFPTVMKGKEYNSVLWQITEFHVVGEIAAQEPEFTAISNDDIPF